MFASGDGPKRRANSDKTAENSQQREYRQWNPHRRRRLVRNVGAVMFAMPVCRDVMRGVFMHWSNVFAWFVSRTIACRRKHRIVRRESLVVGGGVRFVSLAAGAAEKSLLAPERHRHETRHVERGAGSGDRAD